jgi:hypothetical protein
MMHGSGKARGQQAAGESEDRLTVRQAVVVWLIAAACGWLLTVGAVYLAARVL